MSTVLLTGKTGQVGRQLMSALSTVGEVVALGRQDLDLTDAAAIRRVIRQVAPEIIINAAAYTSVDGAESAGDVAMSVNGIAPGIMAEEAKRVGSIFVHYSTDYVFDGKREEPYAETDEPHPINAYGASKLAGERSIVAAGGDYFIVRTSWIYSDTPPNFVLAILRLAREKTVLPVVRDQIGSPTWAKSLAYATSQLIHKARDSRTRRGIYHLSAGGYTTRYDFAARILDIAQRKSSIPLARIEPVTTAEYPLPAMRPLNSATSKDKIERAFQIKIAPWEHDLEAFLEGPDTPLR